MILFLRFNLLPKIFFPDGMIVLTKIFIFWHFSKKQTTKNCKRFDFYCQASCCIWTYFETKVRRRTDTSCPQHFFFVSSEKKTEGGRPVNKAGGEEGGGGGGGGGRRRKGQSRTTVVPNVSTGSAVTSRWKDSLLRWREEKRPSCWENVARVPLLQADSAGFRNHGRGKRDLAFTWSEETDGTDCDGNNARLSFCDRE